MSLQLSQRAKNLKTSPTLFLVAKAKELASQGHDVISLTVGEPDWQTFPKVSAAGIEAIEKGVTKYTAAPGTIELRKTIAERIKTEIGQVYTPAEITVGSGAKFIIFAALQMLCSPGDEVILSAPYWVSYPTMIELADGVPVIVNCGPEQNFKITAAQLEKAITPKTRAFLFCSPSNPTGISYTADELKSLAEVFKKHPQVAILSDDIYNRLNFDGKKVAPHILDVAPDLKDRTVTINGGSKAYSMTGWRIGWAAGPAALIKAMGDYQSQSTGAPSSIAQYAAEAGLKHCEQDIADVVKTLVQRKEKGMKALAEVPGFQTATPQGAFYFWVKVSDHFGKSYKGQTVANSKDFCGFLLSDYYVATVPGSECGTEGYMRLSFATSEDLFGKAIGRMKEFISELK